MSQNERLSTLKQKINQLKTIPPDLQFTQQQMKQRMKKIKGHTKLFEDYRKQYEERRKNEEERKQQVQNHFIINNTLVTSSQISQKKKVAQVQPPSKGKFEADNSQNNKSKNNLLVEVPKAQIPIKNPRKYSVETQDEQKINKIQNTSSFDEKPNQTKNPQDVKPKLYFRNPDGTPILSHKELNKNSRHSKLFGNKIKNIQDEQNPQKKIMSQSSNIGQKQIQAQDNKSATQPKTQILKKQQTSKNNIPLSKILQSETKQDQQHSIYFKKINVAQPPHNQSIFDIKPQKYKQKQQINITPRPSSDIFSHLVNKSNNSERKIPVLHQQPDKNQFTTSIQESRNEQGKPKNIFFQNRQKQQKKKSIFQQLNTPQIKQIQIKPISKANNVFNFKDNQRKQQKKQEPISRSLQTPLPTHPQPPKNIFSKNIFAQQQQPAIVEAKPSIFQKKQKQPQPNIFKQRSISQNIFQQNPKPLQNNIFTSSTQPNPLTTPTPQINPFKINPANPPVNIFASKTTQQSKIFGNNPLQQKIKLVDSFALTKPQHPVNQQLQNASEDEQDPTDKNQNDPLVYEDNANPSKSNFYYNYEQPQILFKCQTAKIKINGKQYPEEWLSLQKLNDTKDYYLYFKTTTNQIVYCGKIMKTTYVKDGINPNFLEVQLLLNCTPKTQKQIQKQKQKQKQQQKQKQKDRKPSFDPVKIIFSNEADSKNFRQSLQKCKPC